MSANDSPSRAQIFASVRKLPNKRITITSTTTATAIDLAVERVASDGASYDLRGKWIYLVGPVSGFVPRVMRGDHTTGNSPNNQVLTSTMGIALAVGALHEYYVTPASGSENVLTHVAGGSVNWEIAFSSDDLP